MADDEIEVELVDELPSRLEDAEEIIVSTRADDIGRPVRGSTTAPCVDCGHAVWLAPSSQVVLHRTGWPVACVQCVASAVAEADDGR